MLVFLVDVGVFGYVRQEAALMQIVLVAVCFWF